MNPKFKKFLHRINRGIALGIAFILVMTVFIIASEATFEKEKPVIEQKIKDFLADAARLNEYSADVKIGEKLTAEQKQAKLSEINALNAKYTNSEEIPEHNLYAPDEILERFTERLDNKVTTIVKSTEFFFSNEEYKKIQITNNGPGCALVNFNFDYKTEFVGNSDAFWYGSYQWSMRDEYGMQKSYDLLPEFIDPSEYLESGSGNGQIYMTRTGGEWRISGISLSVYVETHECTTDNTQEVADSIKPDIKKLIEDQMAIIVKVNQSMTKDSETTMYKIPQTSTDKAMADMSDLYNKNSFGDKGFLAEYDECLGAYCYEDQTGKIDAVSVDKLDVTSKGIQSPNNKDGGWYYGDRATDINNLSVIYLSVDLKLSVTHTDGGSILLFNGIKDLSPTTGTDTLEYNLEMTYCYNGETWKLCGNFINDYDGGYKK